ncbi:MAG: hypothetical protein M3125_02235 [Gemmatimonadota bacterium]|nr:hypothetical protein [Gemmatimonadota bacterium]
MKAYVMTTGVIFALLVVAHIWRVSVESQLATDPAFIMTTILGRCSRSGRAGRLAWRLRSQ